MSEPYELTSSRSHVRQRDDGGWMRRVVLDDDGVAPHGGDSTHARGTRPGDEAVRRR